MGNRVIEDHIVLHQPQGLTEPQTRITDQSNGPAGLIVHLVAALLDCIDDVQRNAWPLLYVSIDVYLVDDHTRESRVGIKAQLFADVIDQR